MPADTKTGDRPVDTDAFRSIFNEEQLHPLYHPIFSLNDKGIHGYEALIRGPAGSDFESPHELFQAAEKAGLAFDFELLCRKLSIREFARLEVNSLLFLNVSPNVLLHPNFKRGKTIGYLREYGVDISQVVIEVTENEKIHSYKELQDALRYYRSMGFRIALDDMGTGYSGLRLWTEVLPDYIKIDRHFISGIDQDPMKLNFVKSLLMMAKASGCKIIAEGVEKREELEILTRYRLQYVQGHYFGLPTSNPPRESDSRLFIELPSSSGLGHNFGGETVVTISRNLDSIPADTTVRNVLNMFQKKPAMEFSAILEGTRPVGLIARNLFFNRLMQNELGVELYGRRKITEFMDNKALIFEYDSQLSLVSQDIISQDDFNQAVIVTRNGEYHGVALVRDLLEKITEYKMQAARHANPLTLLPGAVPVNIKINELITDNLTFNVAYFDLDNFKPFNDVYGYDAGDAVICLLADVLTDIYGDTRACVGHIGGDDFLVVDLGENYENACESVIDLFQSRITRHYIREGFDQEGIHSVDRKGNKTFFPLVSISVGVVPSHIASNCKSHIEIADLASEAKKEAKRRQGNSYFVNLRSLESGQFRSAH